MMNVYNVVYIENGIKNEVIESGLDKNDILNKYNNLGAQVVSIEDLDSIRKIYNNHKYKFNDSDLSNIFSNLSILLDSGLGIRESIIIISKSYDNYSIAFDNVEYLLSKGYTLSKSFNKLGLFDSSTIGIIKAGEESGNLKESFNLLAEYYKNEKELKQQIVNSLYYPLILMVVSLLVIYIVMSYVFPQYIMLFDSYGLENLPKLTIFLIKVSNFITSNIIIITLILILLGYAIYRIGKIKKYRIKLDEFILKTPFIGKFIYSLELQRYSGVLYIMVLSGLDLLKCVDVASGTVNNLYLSDEFKNIKNYLLSGNSLHKSYKEIGTNHPIFLNLIYVGEQSGRLGKTVGKAYEYIKEQNKEYTKKFISLFEPLTILIVGFVIGLIVLGIALPTFNIINII